MMARIRFSFYNETLINENKYIMQLVLKNNFFYKSLKQHRSLNFTKFLNEINVVILHSFCSVITYKLKNNKVKFNNFFLNIFFWLFVVLI